MGGQKKRRVAPSLAEKATTETSHGSARWAELPREIVAMIASYTCADVEPLPFTCLSVPMDPESCAYHRQEAPSLAQPCSHGTIPQLGGTAAAASPEPQGLGSGVEGAGAGPSSSRSGGPGAYGTQVPVPGIFRPRQMSETALAMRCVCRLWCMVLSEGVRQILLQHTQPVTLWASHFPNVTHMGLLNCPDLQVRSPDPVVPPRLSGGSDGGGSDRAGPGPSSAAAAGGSGGRRLPRRGSGSGGGAGAAASPCGTKSRSLAALTSLRNLQVADTAVHLDLAASCPQLEELVVVCAQFGQPFRPAHPFGAFGFQPGSPSRRANRGAVGVGGAAAPSVTRRSALDRTLSSLLGLRRLRLSGVDASAARLGSALMALRSLTSLRLHQCSLPTFFKASGRGRSSHSTFGRELLTNLGAKLQDLSLQGCRLSALPEEVLAGLTGLRWLDLSANSLTRLPDSLTMLVQLEYLDLLNNALSSLPNGLRALSRLSDLDLSGNHLHRLPDDFGALTSLKHLQLGGLHGLDMELCCSLLTPLTNLHSLDLCDVDLSTPANPNMLMLHNGGGPGQGAGAVPGAPAAPVGALQTLVSALGPAGRLRELLLDGCGLAALPPNFSELTALSHLSIMENFDGSALPDGITCLRGLAVLRLGYLDLSGPLPAGFFELSGLRELDLEQNFLPHLAPDISKLSNLQALNLLDAFDPDVPATAVPWTAIYCLTRLCHLGISGQEVQPRMLRGVGALTNLEVLRIRAISVTGPVLEEICTALRGLTYLELESAGISALPASITKLAKLTDLQLCYNRFPRLPPGIESLTRLTALGLGYNPHLRSLPYEITRLSRLRCLNWSVDPSTTTPPSAELLAWLAGLPECALFGDSTSFVELAKSYNICWPRRACYW